MIHKTDRDGNALVLATIGIENRGNESYNLDGYILKASILFEGVLMDEGNMSLNGTLEPNSITSRRFEFFLGDSLSSGDEVKIWAVIEDDDSNVLDLHDFYYRIP